MLPQVGAISEPSSTLRTEVWSLARVSADMVLQTAYLSEGWNLKSLFSTIYTYNHAFFSEGKAETRDNGFPHAIIPTYFLQPHYDPRAYAKVFSLRLHPHLPHALKQSKINK